MGEKYITTEDGKQARVIAGKEATSPNSPELGRGYNIISNVVSPEQARGFDRAELEELVDGRQRAMKVFDQLESEVAS